MLDWLLQTTMMTAVLALLALLFTQLFRRDPVLCHVAWTLILLRFGIPEIPIVVPDWPSATNLAPFLAMDIDPEEAASSTGPSPLELVFVGWILGTVGYGLATIRKIWLLNRVLCVSTDAPKALRNAVRKLSGRLGVTPPRVHVLAGVSTPFVFGCWRPVLIWPSVPFSDKDPANEAVLAHELAHLKRRDHWLDAAGWILVSLWWWNPVAHFVRAQVRRWQEQACDAWALRATGVTRREYAEALLQATQGQSKAPGQLGLAWISGSTGTFRQRLRGLYARPQRASWPAYALPVTLLLFSATHWTPARAETTSVLGTSVPETTAPRTSVPTNPNDGGIQDTPDAALEALLDRYKVRTAAELIETLERRIRTLPSGGEVYAALGFALASLDEYEAAIAAFEEQYRLRYVATYASYNIACCCAKLDDENGALLWLERSVQSGFAQDEALIADRDFDSLKSLPEYAALLQRVKENRNNNP